MDGNGEVEGHYYELAGNFASHPCNGFKATEGHFIYMPLAEYQKNGGLLGTRHEIKPETLRQTEGDAVEENKALWQALNDVLNGEDYNKVVSPRLKKRLNGEKR